jgi:hypothetical protein
MFISSMNRKQRKTLEAVFDDPINGTLIWRNVESLLVGIGCRVIEGSGSSVTFEKDGLRATFHRPHPQKEALRYRIKDARQFLENLGVRP